MEAAGRVAAIECPRQQHVLSADQDRRLFWIKEPLVSFNAAHELVKTNLLRHLQIHEPFCALPVGLVDQYAHWQTVDEATRCGLVAVEASPKPAQNGRRRLSRSSRCTDQVRYDGREGESLLVRVRVAPIWL